MALVFLNGGIARAEDQAPADVQPHLFDDFNGNGVSDSIDAAQPDGNQTPSRLTDDADQAPYYPPAESN